MKCELSFSSLKSISSVPLISVKGLLFCPVFFTPCSACSSHLQPSFYYAFDSPNPQCGNGSLLPGCQALCLFKHTFSLHFLFLTVVDLHSLCLAQLTPHYHTSSNCRHLSPKRSKIIRSLEVIKLVKIVIYGHMERDKEV